MASLAIAPDSPPPPPAAPRNFIKLSKRNFKKIERVLNDKDHKDPDEGEDGIIYHYVEGPPKRDGSPRIYNLDDEMNVYLLRSIIGMPHLRARARSPDEEEAHVQGIYRGDVQGRGTRRRRRRKRRSSRRTKRRTKRSRKSRRRMNRRTKRSRKSRRSRHKKRTRKSKKHRKGSTKKLVGGNQGYAFNGNIKDMALAMPMPRTEYDTCPPNDS